MTQAIRVMVIDDSAVFRSWLVQSLSADSRFEVVGFATNALDAQNKLPLLKPDILTLDIEMPGMSGIDFLKKLLPVHPIPVILVSSLNLRVFDALEAGAVDFVRKPDASQGLSREIFMNTLKTKLVMAASSHVHLPPSHMKSAKGTYDASPGASPHNQRLGNLGKPGSFPAGNSRAGLAVSSSTGRAASPAPSNPLFRYKDSSPYVIAIGASTGGTEAILEVVRQFPANTPGVVITQHMPAGFTAMYADRLNRSCAMEVREAKNGDHIRPGLILLAPGGMQMRVVAQGNAYSVSVLPGEKVNGHRPSVDVLFDSVAAHVRQKAIGGLLTGMGAGGAAGLLRMRKNGAFTIGQDKNSCVVYGMPMEAWRIGAVCRQLPLNTIGQAVLNQLARP